MDNSIVIPNSLFDFAKIKLSDPVSGYGGSYFTKLYNLDSPLYIQSPVCETRQGFVKSNKKIHSDLVFSKKEEPFIQWITDLEQRCVELIHENSDDWFQNPLEMSEIENAFNSIVKINKSNGYMIRSNVKIHTMTKEPVIKVYNQSETIMTMQDVTQETNIITILEVQGVKFTTRSFQLEMEIKQVMILDKDIFDNCLIKPDLPVKQATLGKLMSSSSIEIPTSSNLENNSQPTKDINSVLEELDAFEPVLEEPQLDDTSALLSIEEDDIADIKSDHGNVTFAQKEPSQEIEIEAREIDDDDDDDDDEDEDEDDDDDSIEKLTFGEDTSLTDFETLGDSSILDSAAISLEKTDTFLPETIETEQQPTDNLDEIGKFDKTDNSSLPSISNEEDKENLVMSIIGDIQEENEQKDGSNDSPEKIGQILGLEDISLDELNPEDDPIKLNPPNEHYYELFQQARAEAKEAKKRAKDAYLQAKNIKKNHMLEELSDTSEDSLENFNDIDIGEPMNQILATELS